MENIRINRTSSGSVIRTGGPSLFLRLANNILLGLIFLLPIFFVPIFPISFQLGKSSLLIILTFLMVIFACVAILKEGKISVPKDPILISILSLPLIYLISALFSSSPRMSIFGYGLEADSFIMISVLALLVIFISLIFRTKDKLFSGYLFFFASFALVALFQLLRLVFGPEFLHLNVFGAPTSNLIGKWTDLGAFFGLAVILSLVSIEFLSLSKLFRGFLYTSLVVSLFFLAVVNFSLVWILLGLFAFVLFTYLFSFGPDGAQNRKTSVPALSVIILSIIFLLAGGVIGDYTSRVFNTGNIDARPSWASTIDVSKASLKESPILGAGPNRFVAEWIKNKPTNVNDTLFWNVDFSFGVGFLPSVFATVGILGAIIWASLLLFFGRLGWKTIIANKEDKLYSFLNLSSFLASLYLWLLILLYSPSLVMIALAFIFTGIFIASLSQSGIIKTLVLDMASSPKVSFLSVFLLILLSALSLFGAYVGGLNVASHVFFQKGVLAANAGDLGKSEALMVRAVNTHNNDIYLRTLADLQIAKINNLLGNQNLSADEARNQFQMILGSAVDSAKLAIDFNQTNYENWLALGRVYESVVPLQIAGAYEEAEKVYTVAGSLNPKSPITELYLARLDIANGNNAGAREHIGKALTIKNNYTEAIFLLSQIEVNEGNIDKAISSVETAAVIAPNDPIVFFNLGLLKYNDKDYDGAIPAFERAVVLNNFYSNAKYFLGLSYEKEGRTNDAIAQFEDLAILNPVNPEVKLILDNLKAGRDPFSDARPPLDASPESRDELPIEE